MVRRTVILSATIQLASLLTGACQAAGAAQAPTGSMRARKAAVGPEYNVGPGQAFARLADVPWEDLAPGDTVRVFWREAPYNEKLLINRTGTAAKPIRIVGMPGP